jgi:glycosyltransferase involved in cell wall biosynthesis
MFLRNFKMTGHSTTSFPRVRVIPLQPHCLAFGGFEVQMISAMESARSVGADVLPLDFWSRGESFEILHLWGLDLQHRQAIHWGKLAGKKILISALIGYPGWGSRLRFMASYILGPARLRKQILSWVDGVTVVNLQQKLCLIQTYGFPADSIYVVPNIVEDAFFSRGEEKSDFDVGLEDYVICTGNVCRRKNQLSLAGACKSLGVPLLIVGEVLYGEEAYGKALSDLIACSSNIRWIKGLAPASGNLISAYQGALAFALPSFDEQQPISALEAAACGKPLLLADRPYAKQELYANAALANPDSIKSIGDNLRKVLDSPERYSTPINNMEICRRTRVGESYVDVYNKLSNK